MNKRTARFDVCVDRIPGDIKLEDIADSNRGRSRPRALGRELAIDARVLWDVGQELRVRFLDGTPKMHAAVEEIGRTWEKHANIKLAFGNFPDAEIRISFQSALGGYWSYLGKVALLYDQAATTMSFTNGWDDHFIEAEPQRVRRTVLHEFGHALGLIHEHQSPAAGIPWDREKVYAYYLATEGWDQAAVDAQVLTRYDQEWYYSTKHDRSSIMQYPVLKELTIGGHEIPWNDDLSETDRQAVGLVYPFV